MVFSAQSFSHRGAKEIYYVRQMCAALLHPMTKRYFAMHAFYSNLLNVITNYPIMTDAHNFLLKEMFSLRIVAAIF